MEAARNALTQRKIRHIGVSSPSMVIALRAVTSDLFETIQFPFNFVINEAEEELLPLAARHDVGFIARNRSQVGCSKMPPLRSSSFWSTRPRC